MQWTYCVHMFLHCTYILKYKHVITTVTNLCNYICNYTADPPLTLKPTHATTPIPNLALNSSKSVIQHEHKKYIILIFQCKYIVLNAT